MRQVIVHIALTTGVAFVLTGCGFADSRSALPGFMRASESGPPPLEPPPDVRELLRKHLDSVFVAASAPRNVQVSPARHDLRGPGWTACVRADLPSANGKPLG